MKLGGFLLLITLSSCSIYRSSFDCRVPSGLRCKSVSEIEAMIVESEEGSDYLCSIPCRSKKQSPHQEEHPYKSGPSPLKKEAKVWICPQLDPRRGYVEGHYVYVEGVPRTESQSQLNQSGEVAHEDSQ